MEEANTAERLPAITAALVLETVGLEVFRDKFGMRQCIENGIGPRRKKLGMVPKVPLTQPPAVEAARDEARVLLAEMCRVCPFTVCKMKGF